MESDVTQLIVRGAYYQDLLDTNSSIIRQVTSFEYLELPSVSIRTSLTIDGEILKSKFELMSPDEPLVEFPLGLFPKSLLGSFSVCDESGCALPLLASRYDSEVAVGIMLHALHSEQIAIDRMSQAVVEKLRRIASMQDGDGIKQSIKWMATLQDPDESELKTIFGNDLYELIVELGDIDGFCDLLELYGTHFIPIVQLSKDRLNAPFVIKHSEVTHSPELSLYKRVGLLRIFDPRSSYLLNPKGGTISIKGANLGLAGSQHFRVQAPAGTVITKARMIDPESSKESLHSYLAHVTPRWATLYTKRDSRTLGQQDVRITLIPDARTMMLPAVAALLLSVLVLGIGTTLQIMDSSNPIRQVAPRLDKIAMNSSGAIVAIFLLLPSLYMLALVRRDEHGVATGLLRQPRYAITIASMVVVASAVPATFSMSSHYLTLFWAVALIVSGIVLLLIIWHWVMIEGLKRNASTKWNHDDPRGGPMAATSPNSV